MLFESFKIEVSIKKIFWLEPEPYATLQIPAMKVTARNSWMNLLLVGFIAAACCEAQTAPESTDPAKVQTPWFWLFSYGKPVQPTTTNETTRSFLKWMRSGVHSTSILAIRLSDQGDITTIQWNICAYANEEMVERLLQLPKLASSSILTSKQSLPDETLDRLRKARKDFTFVRSDDKVAMLEIRREGPGPSRK